MDSAKRVISGTFTEVWLDGEQVGEAYGIQLKVSFDKEDVPMCGVMGTDKKVVAYSCTGTLRMYKTNSRMATKVGENIRNGKDVRFTLISKVDDPDAYGAERVAAYNVSFDDLTLADYEARTIARVEAPFTFTDYELLDIINV